MAEYNSYNQVFDIFKAKNKGEGRHIKSGNKIWSFLIGDPPYFTPSVICILLLKIQMKHGER